MLSLLYKIHVLEKESGPDWNFTQKLSRYLLRRRNIFFRAISRENGVAPINEILNNALEGSILASAMLVSCTIPSSTIILFFSHCFTPHANIFLSNESSTFVSPERQLPKEYRLTFEKATIPVSFNSLPTAHVKFVPVKFHRSSADQPWSRSFVGYSMFEAHIQISKRPAIAMLGKQQCQKKII